MLSQYNSLQACSSLGFGTLLWSPSFEILDLRRFLQWSRFLLSVPPLTVVLIVRCVNVSRVTLAAFKVLENLN